VVREVQRVECARGMRWLYEERGGPVWNGKGGGGGDATTEFQRV